MIAHRDMRAVECMSVKNLGEKVPRKESQKRKAIISWDLQEGLLLKIKLKNSSNMLKQRVNLVKLLLEAPFISTWTNRQFNLWMLCILQCFSNLSLISLVSRDKEMILIFNKCKNKNIIQRWINSKLWACLVENVPVVTQNQSSTISITLIDTLSQKV